MTNVTDATTTPIPLTCDEQNEKCLLDVLICEEKKANGTLDGWYCPNKWMCTVKFGECHEETMTNTNSHNHNHSDHGGGLSAFHVTLIFCGFMFLVLLILAYRLCIRGEKCVNGGGRRGYYHGNNAYMMNDVGVGGDTCDGGGGGDCGGGGGECGGGGNCGGD